MVTAAQARAAFADIARAIEERQAELDRLDAVTGDGDHGATMVMGLRAVTAALPEDEDSVAELLRIAAGRFRIGRRDEDAGAASAVLVWETAAAYVR